jgi:hypothetical protein
VTVASIAVEEALLLLKIGFLVLLYLFIWRVVRAAGKDLRAPQESFILAPQQARKPPEEHRVEGRLVLVGDEDGRNGETVHEIDTAAVTLGRGPGNDIPLDDEFASSFHARIETRRDGVWIQDVGSTNGTSVNGVRITAPQKLRPGDLVRIGETDLRFER